MIKVYTESGSCYTFDERLCHKYDADGHLVDVFKAFSIKSVPIDTPSMRAVWSLPESEPEIGMHMYVSGKDTWWLSTPVVKIVEE